ncbi:nitroreductase [Nonlabens dokdonensis]|uniref:Nitroreductase n=2 Tax=Nonlabens dokdonensis TaxID=328515 RepID=A0ABX5PXR2_9FLAO|nr:nitroreductase [Nonlabens dokdonensis]AGC77693.1 putative nitroreductase [Nonlabens dokdonensis DSW-6]PZX39770.1 nitroreductase [Nonlabens dokdonensis]
MNKSLEQLIQSRRSIFPAQYTGGEIPHTDLLEILESARWAPNHKKTEPWRYKVLEGQAITDLGNFMCEQFVKNTGKPLSFKLKKLKEKLAKTSVMILIFKYRDEKESIPEWEETAAVSMSVQNMWLTTHQLGYGCYWSSPKAFANMSQFKNIRVDGREEFLGFFYLGTYEKEQEIELPQRKTIEEFVQFVK